MCGRIEVLENEKNKEKKKKRRRRRGRRCVKFISSAEQSSFTYKLIRRSVEWQIEHRNGCDVRETSTRRHPVCQTDNELSTHRSPGWPINTKVNIRTNLHQIQWTCSWCNLSSYITLVNRTLLNLLHQHRLTWTWNRRFHKVKHGQTSPDVSHYIEECSVNR